jgi:hypothetical protein
MRLELISMGTQTDTRGTKKLIGALRDCGNKPKISLQKSYNTPRFINEICVRFINKHFCVFIKINLKSDKLANVNTRIDIILTVRKIYCYI